MNRTARVLAGLAASALLVGGCGYDETPLPEQEAAAPTTPAAPPACENGPDDLRSYEPVGDLSNSPTIDRIRAEGLRVGVSADTFRMAAANPEHDNRLEGFDIEIVKAIGEAIFGADFNPGRDIEYKVITAAQRIELLQEDEIDLVVRNMTITCDRWDQIDFSAEYYHATQKVLVREDIAYDGPADLAELQVCAPTGSTSLANITTVEPDAIPEPAPNHTGCLVKFQNGEVDAITGDDTVLAGLAAQDPYAVVPDQDPLSTSPAGETPYGEPYGVGVADNNEDLVRFVNQVLEDMREDGSWQRAYNKWLAPYLGDDGVGATQPTPVYGR